MKIGQKNVEITRVPRIRASPRHGGAVRYFSDSVNWAWTIAFTPDQYHRQKTS